MKNTKFIVINVNRLGTLIQKIAIGVFAFGMCAVDLKSFGITSGIAAGLALVGKLLGSDWLEKVFQPPADDMEDGECNEM